MRFQLGRGLALARHPRPPWQTAVAIMGLSSFGRLRQLENDNIVISMEPKQSAMARLGLGWTLSDLAAHAGVGRATAARFELGEVVSNGTRAKLERALTEAGTQFSRRVGRVGVTVPE